MALRNSKLQERLTKFTEENAKLQNDIGNLEGALALHKDLTQKEESSVRGILRKEIGGSVWKHGGEGSLTTYKSSKQLKSSSPNTRKQKHANIDDCEDQSNSTSLKEVEYAAKTKKFSGQRSPAVLARKNEQYFKRDAGSVVLKKGARKNVSGPENVNHSADAQELYTSSDLFIGTYSDRITAMKDKVFQKAAAQAGLDRESTRTKKATKKKSVQSNSKTCNYETSHNNKARATVLQNSASQVTESKQPVVPSIKDEIRAIDAVVTRDLGDKEHFVGDAQVNLWLNTLSLKDVDKYAKVFAENEIDIESLKLISEDQLKEMGVTAVGPLNKILFAICELRGEDLDDKVLTARSQGYLSARSEGSSNTKSSHEGQSVKSKSVPNAQKMLSTKTNSRKETEINKRAMTKKSLSAKLWKGEIASSEKPVNIKEQSNAATASRKGVILTGIEAATKKIALERKKQNIQKKRQEAITQASKKSRDQLAAKHVARKIEAEEDKKEQGKAAKRYQKNIELEKSQTLDDILDEVISVNVAPKIKQLESDASISQKPQQRISNVTVKKGIHPTSAIPTHTIEIEEGLTLSSNKCSITERPKTKISEETARSLTAAQPLLDDLQALELKVQNLQKKDPEGGTVSADLVDNLQKHLTCIQQQIQQIHDIGQPNVEDSSRNKEPSFSKAKFACKPVVHASTNVVESASKGSMPATAGVSMSKSELLREVRKQKDDHRKHVRHLESELSRLKHIKDPVKTCELPPADIIFDETDLIGEGAFSQVYRGIFQGSEVAIKRLKVPLAAQDRNYFSAEVSLLHELRHPRVVLLIGVCTQSKLPVMVLEYMSQGSLYSILHDPTRSALDHVAYYQIARDTALGMNYLHRHRPAVLHLDLKSMNVLLGSHGRAKIADFGFSKLRHEAELSASQSNKKSSPRGTPAWMAPELLDSGDVTVKTDVYSCGIILWEMLTRKHPYEGCSLFEILERVRKNKRPEIPRDCPDGLRELIMKCWDPNHARRPPFKDILTALENLSFPPEWQRLLSAAGISKDAMDDIQSARRIITLVNQTLQEEQRALSSKSTNRSSSPLRRSLDDGLKFMSARESTTFKSKQNIDADSRLKLSSPLYGENMKSGNDFGIQSEDNILHQETEQLKTSHKIHSEDMESNFDTVNVPALSLNRLSISSPLPSKRITENTEYNLCESEDFVYGNYYCSMQPKPAAAAEFQLGKLNFSEDYEDGDENKYKNDSDYISFKNSEESLIGNQTTQPDTKLSSRQKHVLSSRSSKHAWLEGTNRLDIPPPPPPPLPTTDYLASLPRKSQAMENRKLKSQTTKKKALEKPVTIKSVDLIAQRERLLPAGNDESIMQGEVSYNDSVIKSVDLKDQKKRLQSTLEPHPNQLKDLTAICEENMQSLADILRKAVIERRPAMTNRDDKSQDHYSYGDSGWSVTD